MKNLFLFLFVSGSLWLLACNNENNSNLLDSNGNNNEKTGFGVSGLLFENNLVMWNRENQGNRSELFPQMYFTRADASNFPTWGSFPSDQMVSGGVPRDGIPALTNPRFVAQEASDAGYLRNSDIVLGVITNGVAKAYPENILWWHELVNDEISGQKVMMTFCPLTGSGLFFRKPDQDSDLDRLELLPVIETTWGKWKELYPMTTVISGNTGFNRNYTVYPYGSYRSEQTQPLFPLRTRNFDTRFPPKHIVLGLIDGSIQKAYPFLRLSDNPIINDVVNDLPVLIVSNVSAKLAIPYERNVNNQVLTYTLISVNPFQMRDTETNSVWNIKGEAISGSLSGARLTQIPAYNAFWFAWSVFWPSTLVYDGN
jgi:hypothetical protein